MNINEESIQRFADYLPAIRNIFGLSAEKLAKGVGISRVTVVNIENGKKPLGKVLYLAMRAYLNECMLREVNGGWHPAYGFEAINFMVDFGDTDVGKEMTKDIMKIVDDKRRTVGRKLGMLALSKEINEELKKIM